MRIGFDVSSTFQEKTGCTWYADSLIRAMVAGNPMNEYFLYHHFARNFSPEAAKGTLISDPKVYHPYLNLGVKDAVEEWKEICGGKPPAGDPEIVQANFFNCSSITTAPIVYVVYDLTFLVCPEFLTMGHYLGCLPGVCEALCNASGFIFISEHTRVEFEKMFPGWLARKGIPHRVTLLASRGLQNPQNKALGCEFWLSVGTIEPRKNHGTLLTAHDLYWEKSLHKRPLVLAGGAGWLSGEIHDRIAKKEKEGKVRYAGYVSEGQLNDLYSQAFAFIYPSHYEGFGLPVLEAMERGVPVITSSTTSLPEVGGDSVVYFDPLSPEDLAAKMLALEENETHRFGLVEKALNRAAQFSWSRTAVETLEFYSEVMSAWGGGRHLLGDLK
jgi:glycosyltransferase involved in cell wall biosynthesis